jgi:putative FmdB family regulatory protein
MPIYEYGPCECGNVFELIQPMTAVRSANCPSCGFLCARRISATVVGEAALKAIGGQINERMKRNERLRRDR